MLPTFYQDFLRRHLNESQILMLQLLVLMLQRERTVKLSTLASRFPQPIKYNSRLKAIQRFLDLPKLCAKLLWFPLIKRWLKSEYRGTDGNRAQRRARKKLTFKSRKILLVVLDRTQWRDHNVLMVSLIWGTHALPVYWELLPKLGSSSLRRQKKVLTPVLRLLKPYPVVVVGDREFHSPKLANWLRQVGVDSVLRQKKNAHIADKNTKCQALKHRGFQPGQYHFFKDVSANKEDPVYGLNLGVYWKRRYRGKGGKEPWLLLTTLSNFKLVREIYQARWGIEIMFRDCKSGGYNLESTRVNSRRLLSLIFLITIAYWLATCYGQSLKNSPLESYLGAADKVSGNFPHQSIFSLGLSGYAWTQALRQWRDLMLELIALKPHKSLHFQRGLEALSLVEQEM